MPNTEEPQDKIIYTGTVLTCTYLIYRLNSEGSLESFNKYYYVIIIIKFLPPQAIMFNWIPHLLYRPTIKNTSC